MTERDIESIETELKTVSELLALLDDLTSLRNRLICTARSNGVPWSRIQELTGLSRQAAYNAAQRGNKERS